MRSTRLAIAALSSLRRAFRPATPLALLAALTIAAPAHAATGTWSGSAFQAWDTSATNWLGVSGTPWDETNGPAHAAVFNNNPDASATVIGTVTTNSLTFGGPSVLQTGTIVLAGANPTIAAPGGGAILSVLSGTGGITRSGGSFFSLAGANTFSGGLTTTAGDLRLADPSALGTGAFTINSTADSSTYFDFATSGTVANNIIINKPGAGQYYYFWQNRNNDVTFAGNFTAAPGAFALFRLNGPPSGTFTLTGSNAFAQDIFTSAGVTFRIGGENAAGTGIVWRPDSSNNITLLDGARFKATIGNWISSYGMETSGTATFAGDIFNDSGSATIATPAGARLSFTGGMMTGVTSGTFTKTGAGTAVLTNASNFNTSAMTYAVTEGVLEATSIAALGGSVTPSNLVLNGGALRYAGAGEITYKEFSLGAAGGGIDASGGGAIGLLSGSAVTLVGSGSRSLTLTGTNTGANELAAVIAGSGANAVSVAKTGAGRWVLTGANTYSGATTISEGTLAIGAAGSIANSSVITVGPGAILDLTSQASGFVFNAGQTLAGSGLVTLAEGQALTISGTLAPGQSPGRISIDGDLLLNAGSTTQLEIAGVTSEHYDAVQQSGGLHGVTFAGVLSLAFTPGWSTQTTLTLFDFDTYAGAFSAVESTGLAAGYTATFDASTGTLAVVPEPGSLVLAGIGIGLAGWLMRRRR